jgi:hypothetical protein
MFLAKPVVLLAAAGGAWAAKGPILDVAKLGAKAVSNRGRKNRKSAEQPVDGEEELGGLQLGDAAGAALLPKPLVSASKGTREPGAAMTLSSVGPQAPGAHGAQQQRQESGDAQAASAPISCTYNTTRQPGSAGGQQ